MGKVLRRVVRIGMSAAVAVGASVLVLPAAGAAVVPAYTSTTYAGYGATSAATSVATFMVVPRVACAGNTLAVAGESTGVQLIASGLHLNASIRTYCEGTVPVYDGIFAVPRSGDTYLVTSTVKVRPGDVVALAAVTSENGSAAAIVDLSGRLQIGYAAGDALTGANPYLVSTGLTNDGNGQVQSSGRFDPGNGVLPGPVPGSPFRFAFATVDGHALPAAAGLFRVDWVDASGGTLMATSPVGGYSNFTLATPQAVAAG